MYDYSYSNGYSSVSSTDAAAAAAIFVAFLGFMLIIVAITYVITAFFMSKMFNKAGIPGWAAWVPVYNSWKLLEMGGQQGFWAILAIVPVVNIVSMIFMYIAMYQIGLKFGKEGVFVLLAIFLPIVWVIWLAVDKTAVWQGAPTQAAATPPETTNQL